MTSDKKVQTIGSARIAPARTGRRIVAYNRMGGTDAVDLAVEAWHYLAGRGFTLGDFLIDHEQAAIVAYMPDALAPTGEVPVGILTYSNQGWIKSLWIQLCYVRPEFRRQGHYRAMFDELVRLAQFQGAKMVQAGIHVDNTDSADAHAALGFKPRYTVQILDVPKT